MVQSHTADIVLSLAGRDKGQLMLVVAEEGDSLLLANAVCGGRKAQSANGASMSAVKAHVMRAHALSCLRPGG